MSGIFQWCPRMRSHGSVEWTCNTAMDLDPDERIFRCEACGNEIDASTLAPEGKIAFVKIEGDVGAPHVSLVNPRVPAGLEDGEDEPDASALVDGAELHAASTVGAPDKVPESSNAAPVDVGHDRGKIAREAFDSPNPHWPRDLWYCMGHGWSDTRCCDDAQLRSSEAATPENLSHPFVLPPENVK